MHAIFSCTGSGLKHMLLSLINVLTEGATITIHYDVPLAVSTFLITAFSLIGHQSVI